MHLRTMGPVVLLALALAAGRAGAQAARCPGGDAVVREGLGVAAPAGQTRVSLVTSGGASVGTFSQAVAGTWTPSAADVAAITAAGQGLPVGTQLLLRWSGAAGGAPCDQGFALVGAVPAQPVQPAPISPTPAPISSAPPAPPPTPTLAAEPVGPGATAESKVWSEGECARAGAEWRQELRRRTGGERFTEIVFLENHDVCYRSRDYGVYGDPIYVGVFTRNTEAWDTATVQYEPCAIEPASPTVLISEKSSVLSGFQSGQAGWRLRAYPERACFNASVVVTLKTSVGTTAVTARTTLEQAARYRATLHLGSAFTTLHDRTFGLRPDGSSQRIYARGTDNNGPEYYAAVVLYALPRYLAALGGGSYPGRDVVHDDGLLDRIGGVVGVGIKDPRKQFVAGLAFEALPGVNVTGTWYMARVTRLAGVNENDVFTGAADAIPTRQVWDREFAWGVSLDLRYVSALVSR